MSDVRVSYQFRSSDVDFALFLVGVDPGLVVLERPTLERRVRRSRTFYQQLNDVQNMCSEVSLNWAANRTRKAN